MISLNPSQAQAVNTISGPVMVLAGAGSGKTRTLVSRLIALIEKHDVSPYKILAVTFSNKAANEMRERVAHQLAVNPGILQLTTFHAFCAKVLRLEAQFLGLSRSFTIYDDSESRTIVKALMGQRGLNQKQLNPYEITSYIDQVKNQGYFQGSLYLSELEKKTIEEHEHYSIYLDYEAELARSNAVDFGGLITGVLQLFQNFPEVLDRYQKRYQYLLVDEYQDTNRAQFFLIKLLFQLHRNIFVF